MDRGFSIGKNGIDDFWHAEKREFDKKKNRKILSQNGNFKNLGNREEIHF